VPLQVADLNMLETYLDGVMNRSGHHPSSVGGIALALLGAVLWKKDDALLELRTYDGSPVRA
jgi:hypothetical protein